MLERGQMKLSRNKTVYLCVNNQGGKTIIETIRHGCAGCGGIRLLWFDNSGKWRHRQGGEEQDKDWMKSVEKNSENRLLCDHQSEPVMANGVILRTVMRPAITWRLPTEHREAR